MWMRLNLFQKAAFLGLALALLLGPAVGAQSSADSAGWVQELVSAYRVEAQGQGIRLEPRTPSNGIRTIEVEGDAIRVNGATVPPSVLRTWLGKDAEALLELGALTPGERRLALSLEPLAEKPAEASAPPAASGPVLEDPRPEASSPSSPTADPAGEDEAPPSSASPSSASRPSGSTVQSEARVSIGKPVTIAEDEVAEDVVVVGSELRIDGEVLGDTLTVGGSTRVDGRVSGNVGAVGGTIYLEDEAEVQGDVVVVGGDVVRDPAAKVFGRFTEVSLGDHWPEFGNWLDWDWGRDWGWRPRFHSPFPAIWRATGGFSGMVLLGFFAALVFLILQPQVRKARDIARREPWKAGLVGLASILAFWIVLIPLVVITSIFLVITIVGIPLVLVLIFAVVVLALAIPLLGYTAVASQAGTWVGERFRWRIPSGLVAVLVGVVAIEIWSVLAGVLDAWGWFFFLPFLLFALFGWMVRFSVWTVGIGAVVLSFFGGSLDPKTAAASPQPLLPPLPPTPETGDDSDSQDDPYDDPHDLKALAEDVEGLQAEVEAALASSPTSPISPTSSADEPLSELAPEPPATTPEPEPEDEAAPKGGKRGRKGHKPSEDPPS
jgi:hypothetical protein